MPFNELLPAIHVLPDPEKLQLICILAEDLAVGRDSVLQHVTGNLPVWTPHNAFEAADALLGALQMDDQPLSGNA